MGRKKKVEAQEKAANGSERKEYLKKALVKHLVEIQPKVERKFDIYQIVARDGCKGSFRDCLKGDFKPEDRYLFREILQELKSEGVLLHIYSQYWARLK